MAHPHPYLVLATPGMCGMVDYRYTQSLFRLIFYCNSHGIPVALEMITHDPILARARSTLVTRFLERPGASHILFIDPNRRFSVRLVLAMLARNLDIITAPASHRPAPLSMTIDTNASPAPPLTGDDLSALKQTPPAPCHEVTETALDFTLIRREALLRMLKAYPELRHSGALSVRGALSDSGVPGGNSGPHSPYLNTLFEPAISPDSREYLSGETAFSRRWRKIGGKIFALGAAPPPPL